MSTPESPIFESHAKFYGGIPRPRDIALAELHELFEFIGLPQHDFSIKLAQKDSGEDLVRHDSFVREIISLRRQEEHDLTEKENNWAKLSESDAMLVSLHENIAQNAKASRREREFRNFALMFLGIAAVGLGMLILCPVAALTASTILILNVLSIIAPLLAMYNTIESFKLRSSRKLETKRATSKITEIKQTLGELAQHLPSEPNHENLKPFWDNVSRIHREYSVEIEDFKKAREEFCAKLQPIYESLNELNRQIVEGKSTVFDYLDRLETLKAAFIDLSPRHEKFLNQHPLATSEGMADFLFAVSEYVDLPVIDNVGVVVERLIETASKWGFIKDKEGADARDQIDDILEKVQEAMCDGFVNVRRRMPFLPANPQMPLALR